MTYTEIVDAIAKMDRKLDAYYHCYRNLREELQRLDAEIMTINKKKWLLEKQLFRVTKCPPALEPKKKVSPTRNLNEIKIEDLSREEILELLKKLRAEGENND